MIILIEEEQSRYTVAGTDINEVKHQNAQSGLSYNETKKLLAKNIVNSTAAFSKTDVEQVKKDIQQNKNSH